MNILNIFDRSFKNNLLQIRAVGDRFNQNEGIQTTIPISNRLVDLQLGDVSVVGFNSYTRLDLTEDSRTTDWY